MLFGNSDKLECEIQTVQSPEAEAARTNRTTMNNTILASRSAEEIIIYNQHIVDLITEGVACEGRPFT